MSVGTREIRRGQVRAKTGTLSGVSALAGFVTSDRPLTFALLLNGTFGEATALDVDRATDINGAGVACTGIGQTRADRAVAIDAAQASISGQSRKSPAGSASQAAGRCDRTCSKKPQSKRSPTGSTEHRANALGT